MRGRGEVTKEEWAVLEPLLRFPQRRDGRGRPPQDTRAVLNGVLWILRTGAQWRELPGRSILRIRPAIDDLSTGCAADNWRRRCARWRRNFTAKACWIWRRASSTSVSRVRKRGSCRGPDQAGQRDEDHGHRRCYQSSSGRQRR
jgi:transposase